MRLRLTHTGRCGCGVALVTVLSCIALFFRPHGRRVARNPVYDCIQEGDEAWVVIIGDSNGRQLFESLVALTFPNIECAEFSAWDPLHAPSCARSPHPNSPGRAAPWADREVIGTYGDASGVRISFRFVSGSATKVRMIFEDLSLGFSQYIENRTDGW